jgi:hypothetical protein
MRKFFAITIIAFASQMANASEYCVGQYNDQITKVNSELGSLVKRQSDIDARVAAIYIQVGKLSADLAAAAGKVPPDVQTIQTLGKQIGDLNREKTELEAEGYKNQDRVVALKGVVPADLQGKLRGCVEATAPANHLVNLAIQALAIVSTGGASLALPPKSLYVDMSAVLNGYPTGGDKSVINEAREAALKALPGGLGDPNNDFGRTVRDPGRIVRCWFGC